MKNDRDTPGWKPSKLITGIPSGKTRVIGVDLFAFEEYLVKDCDTPGHESPVFFLAPEFKLRHCPGSIGEHSSNANADCTVTRDPLPTPWLGREDSNSQKAISDPASNTSAGQVNSADVPSASST